MQITTRHMPIGSTVALAGRFDAHVVPQARTALQEAAALRPTKVFVDLAQVQFIDSSGLACLVQAMKHLREQGGDLILCNLQQPVRIIFELTRLDRAFQIVEETATVPVA